MQFLTKGEIERLEKFNDTAQDLIGSKFAKQISKKNYSKTVTFHFPKPNSKSNIGKSTVQTQTHDQDNVRAATTIIRLFINDGNDKISLRELASIYVKSEIDQQTKKDFNLVRQLVNQHLDDNAELFLHTPLKNSTILRTILYAKYLHRDTQKIKTMKKWQEDDAVWLEIQHAFEHTLVVLTYAIKLVRDYNLKVLTQNQT